MGTNSAPIDECDRALPLLVDGARALGLELDQIARSAFLTYCRTLAETNLRMNLTAIRTATGIMTTLFLDSLTCALALPAEMRSGERTVEVVDIGAGAGLPGL